MSAIRNFKQLSRQNTGSHPLDSGGTYGRHWQRPLPKGLVSMDFSEWEGKDGQKHQELSASIHCGEFLDRVTEIDRETRKQFKAFAKRKSQENNSWWEVVHDFASHIGMEVVSTDYTYNWESDLDQDFQFFVLQRPGNKRDWLCGDNAIFFIQTHNGCDARGGFSEPVPVKPAGDDFTDLLRTEIGWSILEGTDKDGNKLEYEDCQALDEEWQIGYANWPTGKMQADVETVLSVDKDKQQAVVKLKSGETVTIYPNCQAEYV